MEYEDKIRGMLEAFSIGDVLGSTYIPSEYTGIIKKRLRYLNLTHETHGVVGQLTHCSMMMLALVNSIVVSYNGKSSEDGPRCYGLKALLSMSPISKIEKTFIPTMTLISECKSLSSFSKNRKVTSLVYQGSIPRNSQWEPIPRNPILKNPWEERPLPRGTSSRDTSSRGTLPSKNHNNEQSTCFREDFMDQYIGYDGCSRSSYDLCL